MSSGSGATRSCSRDALARGVGEPDDAARLGVERLDQDSGKVATGVAVPVLHLQPEPDGAVLADERRRRAGEQ